MSVLGLMNTTVDPLDESTDAHEGPFVIIANHPTLVDVTALLASYDGITCFVKPSHMNNPFISRLLRYCGHIDAGAGESLAGAAAIQAGIDRLREGFSVLIFPEGTRSPRNALHPFRRGAFELARRAGVPVLPMFITCDPPALMKGVPFWAQTDDKAELHLRSWAPMPPSALEGSSRELAKSLEARYRAALDTHKKIVENALDLPADTGIPRGVASDREP
jgi:1-acyl-sn-glycerol-3-phosphate acyltransferase